MNAASALPTIHHRFFDSKTLVKSYLTTFPGGGLFLRTDQPFDIWTRFELVFDLPSGEVQISCEVEVIWLNRNTPDRNDGMGVRFVRIAPEEKRKLDDFLKTWAHQDELFGGRYVRVVPLTGTPENNGSGPTEAKPLKKDG
jgi:uncharacterized protein (TIGR02266 family)